MSGIDNAKKGMGWQHPNERQSCGTCAKAQVESISDGKSSYSWRCVPGGFLTPRYAVCNQWERRK